MKYNSSQTFHGPQFMKHTPFVYFNIFRQALQIKMGGLQREIDVLMTLITYTLDSLLPSHPTTECNSAI